MFIIDFAWSFITSWFGEYSFLKWLIDAFVLYLLFAWIMVIDKRTKGLKGWKRGFRYVAYPLVWWGYFVDVRFNVTYGNIMFLELPNFKRLKINLSFSELTFSARLQRHLAGPRKTLLDRYRYYQAKGWCWLIQKWSPGHCS